VKNPKMFYAIKESDKMSTSEDARRKQKQKNRRDPPDFARSITCPSVNMTNFEEPSPHRVYIMQQKKKEAKSEANAHQYQMSCICAASVSVAASVAVSVSVSVCVSRFCCGTNQLSRD